MQNVVEMRAGCKVNLSLRITGVREDGYHLLDSIFWPLANPFDTLTFSADQCPHADHAHTLSVSCNIEGINLHDNTLTKAFAAFHKQGGVLLPEYANVQVHLHKGIPHGAGLGGGSSDAAAVLTWCNAHASKRLSQEQMQRAALSVGADVPFFLLGKPARVQGIGEIIEPLPKPWPEGYVVLLCPHVYISTPWAYKKLDEEKIATFEKKLLTKTAFDYRTLFTGAGHLNETQRLQSYSVNDFESVVFRAHPQLAKLKQDLLDGGAALATMSGSGSSLLGIVRSEEAAKSLADTFNNAQCRVFIAAL